MTDFFLRAKHWQIFALSVGGPLIATTIVTMMMLVFSSALDGRFPSPYLAITFLTIFTLSTLLSVCTQFGWLWSITTGLDHLIPVEFKLNILRFKIAFWVPLVYIFLILTTLVLFATLVPLGTVFFSPTILLFILPPHIIAMLCIFYCLFVSAKTIKTADTKKERRFRDFTREFALLWLFPIGVWLIQPTINELYERSKTVE